MNHIYIISHVLYMYVYCPIWMYMVQAGKLKLDGQYQNHTSSSSRLVSGCGKNMDKFKNVSTIPWNFLGTSWELLRNGGDCQNQIWNSSRTEHDKFNGNLIVVEWRYGGIWYRDQKVGISRMTHHRSRWIWSIRGTYVDHPQAQDECLLIK